MKPSEAIDEVARMKGLFPGLTREQEDFWYSQFQKLPVAVVRWAVDELALVQGDFVDRPKLLSLIDGRLRSADERSKAAVRQAADRAAALLRDEAAAAADWSTVDAFIARVPDAALAESKTRVLAKRPGLVPLLGTRDPRTSSTLKALIYGELAGGRKAVAS